MNRVFGAVRRVLIAVAAGWSLSAVGVEAQTDHLEIARQLNREGVELYSAGRYREVIPLPERALAIREHALRPDHPSTAASLNPRAPAGIST
jgi:predicted amino acid racemase